MCVSCWCDAGQEGGRGGSLCCRGAVLSHPTEEGLLGQKDCLQGEKSPKIKGLAFLSLELPRALCCSPVLFARIEKFYSQILNALNVRTDYCDSRQPSFEIQPVYVWVSFIFLSRRKCTHISLTCIILNPFSTIKLFFPPSPFSDRLVAALF